MEIIAGIHQIKLPLKDNPLGYVNTYLLRGTDGWTLIDAGWNDAESFEALNAQLADLGLTIGDISRIIVTHIHPDHFGMAGRIKEISGAELALHEIEKSFIDTSHEWGGSLVEKINQWLRINGV
ncbi:MAG: MBL fold metallo-hydrolase, partial [Chloroflexi bacterium]|nr:MBL fold metallo-hydrolase [Chloroflexota bacterium]